MPTNDNYILDAGANLTPTWGPLATQIEQAIELAVPNSYRGMVIADTATPTTTGAPAGYPAGWYEWQKRCLWLNTSNNQLYGFDGTTWALIKSRPADASIGTSTIIDGAVTISKLSPSGGTAYQIPRINSGATALAWANATDLFNANEIPISKLGDVTSPTSVGSFVLTRNGPTKAWTPFDSATILAILGTNEIPVDYLIRGAALQVPMVNAGGTATVWSSVVSGIADGALPIAKLAPVIADAGKYLRRNPTTGAVESVTLAMQTTPNIQVRTDEILTLPSAGAATSLAHGLSAIPSLVEGYLVCVSADAGYSVGDVVSLAAVAVTGISGTYNYAGGYFVSFDATNVTITANDAATRRILTRSTGAQHTFVAANWKFRFTATRYY